MIEMKLPKVKLPFKLSRSIIIIGIGVGVAIFGFFFIRTIGRYASTKITSQMKEMEIYKGVQLPDVPGFQKLTIEREMERRIQNILDEVVGPRKSIVRVSVELTPQIQNKEEVNTPKVLSTRKEEKVDISSQRGTEKKGGEEGEEKKTNIESGKVPGIPEVQIREGEDYFIYPGYPSLEDLTIKPSAGRPSFERGEEKTGTRAEKVASTTEYALDKKIVETTTPAGSINRLTVFVLVDVNWKKTFTGKVVPVRRSEKEIEQLRTLIENAVGYTPERGDKLEILNIPFTGARPAIEMAEKITTGITILILLPLIYFIVRATMNFIRRRAEERQAMIERMRQEEEAERERKAKEEQELRERIQMHQEQVFTIGKTHPDICARIIRNWLT